MGIASIVAGALEGLAAPITNIFVKKIERKTAKDTINGQVALAKLDNQASVNVGIDDWERLSKANENGTYKDEYVTLSVFSLFNLIVVGSIGTGMGYAWGPEMLDGVSTAITTLNSVDGIVAQLMWMTAAAALSIKTINSIR